MEARENTLEKLLYGGDQYIIPLFQRFYVWEQKDWLRLWGDVTNLLEPDAPNEHFMGSLVCLQGQHEPGRVTHYLVIDGQQRLMTSTILLGALRDEARRSGENDRADEIHEDYLFRAKKKGLERYKVVPRLRDRQCLLTLAEGVEPPLDASRIGKAYAFFRQQIRARADGAGNGHLREMFTVISSRLAFVTITLTDEKPFAIFETLNSTGQRLDEADLVRNHVFMKVPLSEQDAFDDNCWRPLEDSFEAGVDGPAIPLTEFYRDFLMRDGTYVRPNGVYVAFTALNISPMELVKKLGRYGTSYREIHRPDLVDDARVRRELWRFRRLGVSTAYPLVLHLLDLNKQESLSADDLIRCLRALQSFVVRRSIVGESTRAYGRLFPAAIKDLSPDDVVGSLCLDLNDRGWPKDESFVAALVEFPIYRRETGIARLLLTALEEGFGHREAVDLWRLLDQNTLQIEHVLPQNISDGDDANGASWQQALGENWSEVHERWVHSLGNLTLTGYNPALSNHAFDSKRDEFTLSHIDLNHHFTSCPNWGSSEIQARSLDLATRVAQMWPCQ
jgi:hypothetical protein